MSKIITESYQRHYSVAIPFVDKDNLLFQVRSDKLSHQPGDICFPGGAVEDGENPGAAVIRELMEELLLTEDQISIGEEASVLVSDTAIIHCFPCLIKGYGGGFNPQEVAEIFYVPASFFSATAPYTYDVSWNPVFPDDFPFDKIHDGENYGWRPRKSRIRFYEFQNRVIWGMTAKIIEDFFEEG